MKLTCTKCNALIKNWDINIQDNVAKCARCGSVYKVSDLTNPEEEISEVETVESTEENLNEIDQKILALARKGSKLAAVKHCKEENNWGLKESKDYVDSLCVKHGIEPKGACFVATACYDDYDSPEVRILRNYRDEVLMKSSMGRAFVKSYYFTSPFFARQIAKSNRLKKVIRSYFLGPLINRIKSPRN